MTLPKTAEIIGQRGSRVLLIKTGTDPNGRDIGVIWCRGLGISEPALVSGIAKFGYWKRYEGSQAVLAEIEEENSPASAQRSAAKR